MTDEYINNIKKNPTEYMCGHYEVGRYAWVLEDSQVTQPIKTKGELGIWNYYEMNEVMDFMSDIKYGESFDNYKLQSPKELLNSKMGVCWD